jgi:MscS family membrane protein
MQRFAQPVLILVFASLLFGCTEHRIPRGADYGRLGKLFKINPPPWARKHAEMPQFSGEQQNQLLGWLAEGKIEINPSEQTADFAYVNTLEKFLTTGETPDRVTVSTATRIEAPETLVPTQLEIFWGNVVPKIVDSLTPGSRFSACSGKILTAHSGGKHYILDGHHRWAACIFLRRFVDHAEDYRRLAAPFRYYEERKIYELLNSATAQKREIPLQVEVQALEGNPQGIARALFEAAKLGHGRFDRFDTAETPNAAMDYLQNTMLLDSTLLQWLYFAAIILASLIASRLMIAVLQIRQKNRAAESDNRLTMVSVALETMRKYIYTLAFLISVKKGLPVLTLSITALRKVNTGLVVAVIWLATIFAARLFARFMLRWQEKIAAQDKEAEIAHLFPLLIRVGKLLIYIFGVLLILNQIGYNIYSAIAGLSVGGFALAMAGREAVGHIFAGVSLYLDKVVKEGDYLLLPAPIDTWGRVEKVGIRSTTIRTKYNSLLIMPNSLLANQQVDNVSAGGRKRMFRGKLVMAADTPADKLEHAIGEMRRMVATTEFVRDADVHFMKFDTLGFYIRIQFFVEPFNHYHDTVHALNLKILRWLETNGIRVAVNLDALANKR